MKTLIISTLALLLSLTTHQSYTGKWTFEDETSSFTLNLEQQDTIVTGNHFAVMECGNRIDGSDDEETIRGTIKNKQLIVTVKSTYDHPSKPGKAKLTFIGCDSLYFEFITPPTGTYWIPDKVVLTKKIQREP